MSPRWGFSWSAEDRIGPGLQSYYRQHGQYTLNVKTNLNFEPVSLEIFPPAIVIRFLILYMVRKDVDVVRVWLTGLCRIHWRDFGG